MKSLIIHSKEISGPEFNKKVFFGLFTVLDEDLILDYTDSKLKNAGFDLNKEIFTSVIQIYREDSEVWSFQQ